MSKRNKKGFTMIELLISIFVLAIGILGVLALYASSLAPSFANRDEIIASGLAQEGIELVRNVRDTNILAGDDAFAGLSTDNTGCTIDYLDDACSGGGFALSLDGSRFYQHGSGTATKFSRKIVISVDDDNRKITSYVWWKGDGSTCDPNECVSATHFLTPGSWQGAPAAP